MKTNQSVSVFGSNMQFVMEFSQASGSRSVVVITSASHAEGPEFEPQREHVYFLIIFELIDDGDLDKN